jgi:exonuclease III
MRWAALLISLLLASCDPAPETTTVRVMTFNIEWGGTHVSFDGVVDAIRQSGADVVGIQEAEGNLELLADRLGWHYDRRNYVVSRFPLIDPPGADGRYVLVEVEPGSVFALSNLHLPSDPYGPDLVRDGATLDAVLANERDVRMPALLPYLQALPRLTEQGFAVIVTGDFNAPAHTDWTDDMVGERRFLKYRVDWPVSAAMADAGFHDTWRALFPDPATHPGLTWWAGRPPLEAYAPGENDAEDRIDYLWYAGPVTPTSAAIAGEEDGPEVTIGLSPWPSDHRAVYADFEIAASALPGMITTDRRVYTEGDTVNIHSRFDAPVQVTVTDAIRSGTLIDEPMAANARLVLQPDVGEYVVSGSGTEQRRFWVLQADGEPELTLEESGSDAFLRWHNAPGHRNDYIALYPATETDLVNGMVDYVYLDARPHGSIPLSELTAGLAGPEAGKYVARLMKDDGYEVLAETMPFNP